MIWRLESQTPQYHRLSSSVSESAYNSLKSSKNEDVLCIQQKDAKIDMTEEVSMNKGLHSS